ncbi:MAG: PolC-type DNA polymerase III N-terminal domain-containing protein [Eubacteriales bacterium]|nr:PolC-type DNA polymerase III N-terminal domain-containing protein [Eubacteriales bacterium]
MSKLFFDVFPNLKVRRDLQEYFQDTQVERLAANRERTRFKVCLQSGHLIHKDRVFRMQREMEQQLFTDRNVEVYVEERYSLSALYTPRKLMEEYGDSICCEISAYSPVMGTFFRDAKITYTGEDRIDVCLKDSCISRSLRDRLEESLNRIFRDRCGIPATLTVTLSRPAGMDGRYCTAGGTGRDGSAGFSGFAGSGGAPDDGVLPFATGSGYAGAGLVVINGPRLR